MVYPYLLDKKIDKKIDESKKKIITEALPVIIDAVQNLHALVAEKTKGAILMVE